jgi:hypothetical protein
VQKIRCPILLGLISKNNELRELNISRGLFTWSNNHANPILKKLDRILISREWEILFPTIHGHKEPRNMSDHNPLIISTQSDDPRCRREFRYELTWLKHPDFLHRVAEIWHAPTRDELVLDRVIFKIKKVKKFLEGWGFSQARSRKRREKDITEELADLEIMEENDPLNLS